MTRPTSRSDEETSPLHLLATLRAAPAGRGPIAPAHAAATRGRAGGPPRRGAPDVPMPSMLVGRVVGYVRDRGGDADGLLRRFELSATVEHEPATVIPLARLHALLDAAAEAADDPALGVHVAERGSRASVQLLEFACSGVPDLGSALQRYVRYVAALNEQLPVTLEERAGVATVKQRVPGHPDCLGRHGNEHWVVALMTSARHVSGARCVPERVWLAHAADRPDPELVRALGTSRIQHGAGYNGLELGAATLRLPLRFGQGNVAQLLARYASFAAAQRPVTGALDGRVRDAIRARLHHGVPAIGEVARVLGMGARTLQRRLSEDGLSFLGLVDSLREDLARRHMQAGDASITELAERLGYARPSAFLRAFKRWTGTTPKRLRGQQDDR